MHAGVVCLLAAACGKALHWLAAHKGRLCPLALVLINLGAALSALAVRDYRRAVYFCASAVCLAAVGL